MRMHPNIQWAYISMLVKLIVVQNTWVMKIKYKNQGMCIQLSCSICYRTCTFYVLPTTHSSIYIYIWVAMASMEISHCKYLPSHLIYTRGLSTLQYAKIIFLLNTVGQLPQLTVSNSNISYIYIHTVNLNKENDISKQAYG